ncbi:MAG: phosphoribosylanthranilate isomerase [Pseudomonadota bacterium]
MAIDVKICGINEPRSLQAAVGDGARYIGFVFYEPSPRYIAPQMASQLAWQVGTTSRIVGLFVEPSDDFLDDVVSQTPLNMIQLHGDETPGRVAEIRARYSIPVMKAFRIGAAADFDPVAQYEPVADWLLFDARAPKNVASLPGGNGIAFDWQLMAGRDFNRPWMLSGGLNAENVTAAIEATGAETIDISSGVEAAPGRKDPDKIAALLALTNSLTPASENPAAKKAQSLGLLLPEG